MKLVRHGTPGKEKPGILGADGQIRDLSGICDDFGPAFFAKDGLRALRGLDLGGLPIVAKSARLGPCVAQPGNFIGRAHTGGLRSYSPSQSAAQRNGDFALG